jgi:LysM repeat protein
MNKRSSALARALAVTTLVVALVVAVVVIAAALGGGDSSGSKGRRQSGEAGKSASHRKPKKIPATYEVQSGDTLISIAHRNGVSVARIETLNPEVDPQILIAGETLKLR